MFWCGFLGVVVGVVYVEWSWVCGCCSPFLGRGLMARGGGSFRKKVKGVGEGGEEA